MQPVQGQPAELLKTKEGPEVRDLGAPAVEGQKARRVLEGLQVTDLSV
ncbi:MAG: hypothetical protein AAF830_10790 [Pseudomonadota bacterium]